MGLLEETLRDTFAQRAAAPPAIDGLADRAIVGAQKVRRRNAVVASTASLLSVALVVFGALTVATHPGSTQVPPDAGASPSASAGPDHVAFDVLFDATMFVAGGGEFLIAGVGKVNAAWRVPGGYLIEGLNTDSGGLWYIPVLDEAHPATVGDPVPLATGSSFVAGRNAEGRIAVAWIDDNGLYYATLSDGALTGTQSSAGRPAIGQGSSAVPLYPQAVVGGAVVLAGIPEVGGAATWDVWYPDRGNYRPTPDSRKLDGMLGVTADHELIIGRYDDGSGQALGCLGTINPADLTPVMSVCPNPFGMNDRIVPSPDGRWWMVLGPDGMRLYDAAQVRSGLGPVHTWSSFIYAGQWSDDGTAFAAVTTTDTLATFYTDGRQESTALPPAMKGASRPVADLR